MRTESEPINQNEIVCSFCGPGKTASWEVLLTDGEHAYICYPDHKLLSDAELILGEKRIGEMVLEDVLELRQFLNDNEGSWETN
jgi:hypothetical protein